MNKYSYEIKKGYCFIEKNKNVDIWQAREILLSKKQRLYTKATREDMSVCLSSTYLKCPYCGEEYTANSNSKLYSRVRRLPLSERLTKEKIMNWTDTQLSFFPDDINKTLLISEPMTKFSKFCCPKCKGISEHSDSIRHVEVSRKKKKVVVKSEIANINEIFAMSWIKSETISIAFPMYETIIFDCYKGKIYIKLENAEGNLVAHSNITGMPHLINDSAVCNAIGTSKLVNRTVKRMFCDIWEQKLPFSGKEFTVENIFKMTMFVNYPKSFYGYIPYELESINVEKSFKRMARKMNNSVNTIQLFEKSMLPQVKSVKKTFFDKLGLFFYLKEAELLWNEINDYNLFCKLMQSDSVFNVLSSIHMRPGIMFFVKDYCKIKGSKSFVQRTLHSWGDLVAEAIDYVTMSNGLKKEVQLSWQSERKIGRIVRRKALYSTPMHEPDERIKDCNINGYDFFWLRTSKDYVTASNELDNCLGSWSPEDSPVVCVKKDNEYVAAIEVNDGKIIQAYGYDNCSIGSDEELYNAYKIWMKTFSLQKQEYEHLLEELDDDEMEFLPECI